MPAEAEHAPDPTEGLLDRDGDLAALAALIDGAADGHGGVALLEGSPGVGKSALLARAADMARAEGLDVLQARGHDLERSWGWGVVRFLLEPPLVAMDAADRGELLAGPSGAARVLFEPDETDGADHVPRVDFAIVHALRRLVVRLAERRPLLLLVDDAHWADAPSLRFLVHLAGHLSAEPIGVVVGARTGEGSEEGLLDRLAADPRTRVRLVAPLGAAAVTTLVRRSLPAADDDLCRRCFELTGGNPLQVRQLLVALPTGPGPIDGATLTAATEVAARSLGRSVLVRMSSLGPAAQAVAGAVAVLEDDAPLGLAAELASWPRRRMSSLR